MTQLSDPTRGMGRELAEAIPDAVVAIDPEGRIVLANSRAIELLGYTREELIGEPIEMLVPERSRQVLVGHRDGYFINPRPGPIGAGLELRARRRDGSEFPCEISLSASQAGDQPIALAAIRDVSDRKRAERDLEGAVRRLEAAADVAVAVADGTDLNGLLRVIVERGRALVDARALVILLQEGEELVVAATAGNLDARLDGVRFPSSSGVRGLLGGRLGPRTVGADHPSSSALLAPLVVRGRQQGVVVALDRLGTGPEFDPGDERLLEAFAASAATAVSTARSIAADRLQNSIDAAEHERSRWARALHDETLQGLAALRVRLSAALNRDSARELERAGNEAVEQIGAEIERLRNVIAELRPAALDDIGLAAALRAMAERSAAQAGLGLEMRITLPDTCESAARVFETTVYRLVQEALANVAKHARAARVSVDIAESGGRLTIVVRDDGVGFEPGTSPEGFGLSGMRERVALAGGQLDLESAPGAGTTVTATLPL